MPHIPGHNPFGFAGQQALGQLQAIDTGVPQGVQGRFNRQSIQPIAPPTFQQQQPQAAANALRPGAGGTQFAPGQVPSIGVGVPGQAPVFQGFQPQQQAETVSRAVPGRAQPGQPFLGIGGPSQQVNPQIQPGVGISPQLGGVQPQQQVQTVSRAVPGRAQLNQPLPGIGGPGQQVNPQFQPQSQLNTIAQQLPSPVSRQVVGRQAFGQPGIGIGGAGQQVSPQFQAQQGLLGQQVRPQAAFGQDGATLRAPAVAARQQADARIGSLRERIAQRTRRGR